MESTSSSSKGGGEGHNRFKEAVQKEITLMKEPLNKHERLELLHLRKRCKYLADKITMLENKLISSDSISKESKRLLSGGRNKRGSVVGAQILAGAKMCMDSFERTASFDGSPISEKIEAGVAFDKDDLSRFVKLSFDNTTVADVKSTVIPEIQENFRGGGLGIADGLDVDLTTGIASDELAKRKKIFGANLIPMEPQTSIFVLMWEALQDPTLLFLCFASFVSLFIGVVIEQEPLGWLEGTAILTAVIVVVLVGSINDYQKESQFRELNAKKDDMKVTVVREGQKKQVSCHDLVVGDIVILSTGDIVSADGYCIDGASQNDLSINEKMLTGETVMKKKGEYQVSADGKSVLRSPIIFSGTFVQDGEGRMIVLAVGTSTYQGSMQQKMIEADAEKSRSVLQQKLDDMTDIITKAGAGFAVATVMILCMRMMWSFHVGHCCKESWDHHVHWTEVLSFLISGVTIFVVAVPEGLPLAVTIALAFSVKKMLKDNNLVRHLSACETMGSATTICSDKTGTLTTSRMTVVKVFCGETIFTDIARIGLPNPVKLALMDAAVVNTMSKTNLVSGPAHGVPVYTGNDTECGLLVMANTIGTGGGIIDYTGNDMPYLDIRARYPENQEGRKQFTFSSTRKRMSTRIRLPNGKYRVYCKGAAEMVVELCTKRMSNNGGLENLTQTSRSAIGKVISGFANEALRTICIAYKDVDYAIETVEEAEENLVMIALVGIEDPVRAEVPQAIADCRKAGIIVRMVTGDNMQTAAAIAQKCGIVEPSIPLGEQVIDGKTFRERVCDADGRLLQSEFDKIWPTLRVMGRSTPLDKHLLVSGLQASRLEGHPLQTVAVTGDGTNDAPALKKADVGFAMGIQGTDVAKNASDVIIMDDNFVSIVKAVLWGRCVYDNICKFLQFQLTVNITAIVVACAGSAILTESPLTAIQMLWVNLIMDSFASLALATEDPSKSWEPIPTLMCTLLNRLPYARDRGVLSKIMTKNMLLHAAWQLLILGTLIFVVGSSSCASPPGSGSDVCLSGGVGVVSFLSNLQGPYGTYPLRVKSGRPAGYDMASTSASGACPPAYNPEDKSTFTKRRGGKIEPLRPVGYCRHAGGSKDGPSAHYTMVFNVFVLMQLFNEINSRKIHDEANVFDGVLSNPLFLVIIFGTAVGQYFLIEFNGLNTAFGCTSLTPDQWILCLALASSTIPLNLLMRLIPSRIFPGSD